MLDRVFAAAAEKFSLTGVIKGLRAEGYDFINHATNTFASCLFVEESDEVIVVNTDPDWAPAFYKLCESSTNPYLPKVHEMQSFGEQACVARIERLVALDHMTISDEHKELLDIKAAQFVSYMRGENIDEEDAELREAAVSVLKLSQDIYKNTNGRILPFSDIKPSNVFLRPSPDGPQFVLGDPLYPGSGGSLENREFMNEVYHKFGLPALPELEMKRPAPLNERAMAFA